MRVQVNLSEEMVQQIDDFAKKIGVSRSAFCSMLVGQGVLNWQTAYKIMDNVGDKITEDFLKELPSEFQK